MKRKLLLCAVVIAAMLLTLLAGCSKSGNDGKFEGNFTAATAEQTATAVNKLERLAAVEEAVKNATTIDGKAATKSNMIMQASITGSGSMMGANATISMTNVEKYDFSTPGTYRVSADMNSSISASAQGMSMDMKAAIGMYADTAANEVYVSIESSGVPGSGESKKVFCDDFPTDRIKSLFESGSQSVSIEEILNNINNATGKVSVDSDGNIKLTDIPDSMYKDLTYVVIFENENDYSIKKTFTIDNQGITLYCEITILPTSDTVSAPNDADQYQKVGASELANSVASALGNLLP